MSNSETHTVSMPKESWVDANKMAKSERISRSAVFQDALKIKLSADDDKGRRYRLFDVVLMLLLFVIILLLLVVIT